MKLISIVVPVYNAQNYISYCVKSILSQTYTNFELLLIDDGSNDNSYQIIKELEKKDSRIKAYHHDNKGAGFTRNCGIDLAQGDYITFIDSDDYVDQDYLTTLINNIGENDILISGYNKVNMDTHETLFSSIPKNCVWTELKYVSTCAKLYNLHFLKEYNIKYDSLKIGEDVYFNLSANSITSKISIIEYAGYNYCLNNDSVTQSKKNLQNDNKIMELLKRVQSTLCLENKYTKKMISYFYLKTIVQYLLMQINVLDKKDYLLICEEAFAFLIKNGYNNYYAVKDEELKIKICTFIFYICYKFKIMGLLYSILRSFQLQIG